MKKILFILAGVLLLIGCTPDQDQTYQLHETRDTNLEPKEYIQVPDPEPQVINEPVHEPDPEPETHIEEDPELDPEPEFDPAKRFEEIENMTQEERSYLSQDEKDLYGISEDGKFYTESGSSEEQIENNK